jgi:Na+/H+ antiporter NhaC
VDHVVTQLPFAGMAALASCAAYALMAAGMSSMLATATAAMALAGWVGLMKRR